ncbi:MAG: family metallopeptidase, partial [Segetibacter sp.]|nr:family metallopeptidase [Segetibacter sp.]
MKIKGYLPLALLLFPVFSFSQLFKNKTTYTHADTLRGSITEFRKGWDVLQYTLNVAVDIEAKAITGSNEILYYESLPVRQMQIDLQEPLIIDSIVNEGGYKVSFTKEGNAWFARLKPDGAMIKFLPGERRIKIFYHGVPKAAKRAPWDGGVVWKNDANGNPWVATACQGLGASVWWPCKDHQSDEPDRGIIINITAPDTLTAVSNGRLKGVSSPVKGTKTWQWQVVNPINTYALAMNIGKYVSWSDTTMGVAGKLDMQYWVLDYNLEKAKTQFAQAKPMIHCFENWFGKYPFYEDGYKLVESNFLGMEHQSATAYGNGFKNGYLGRDLSGTGWGDKWDFIIIHESGHEWYGNNITSADIADMWIHEGFTNYSESLYTQWLFGKKAGAEYCRGLRKSISNDIPIIGTYGVNKEGSGDMYYKAANMLHIIRQTINNDEIFKGMLREMNKKYYHATVTSAQMEAFINQYSKINFTKVFNQYLRTIQIPKLEYYFSPSKKEINYRWTNSIANFDLPLQVPNGNSSFKLNPSTKWQKTKITNKNKGLLNIAEV